MVLNYIKRICHIFRGRGGPFIFSILIFSVNKFYVLGQPSQNQHKNRKRVPLASVSCTGSREWSKTFIHSPSHSSLFCSNSSAFAHRKKSALPSLSMGVRLFSNPVTLWCTAEIQQNRDWDTTREEGGGDSMKMYVYHFCFVYGCSEMAKMGREKAACTFLKRKWLTKCMHSNKLHSLFFIYGAKDGSKEASLKKLK